MVFRLQVRSTGYTGATGYNSFVSLGNAVQDAEALAADVEQLFSSLAPLLASGTTVLFDGTVEKFDTTTGQTTATESALPWEVNGSGGASEAAAGTCLLLQWRTGVYANGREVRGRSYISGLGLVASAFGDVSTPNLTAARNAAQAYALLPNSGLYSPTNALAYSLSDGACWSKFALMRSRRD